MKDHKKLTFPKTRIATFDIFELGLRKHHVKALLEFDVSHARNLIKNYRSKTKSRLSFTGWLIKTISSTLEEYQNAHSYLKGKKSAIVFNDIDISITVEREYDGRLVPLPYVIRRTNKKDCIEITEEIHRVKSQKVSKEDTVLGEKQSKILNSLYYVFPGIIRRFFWRYILSHPKLAKKTMGSVVLTSVGMMGNVHGWFIHTSVHPISFGVGSIIKKPRVIKDHIEVREILNMTILIDHDVIDGAPMARFISKLSKNIESGYGLTDK